MNKYNSRQLSHTSEQNGNEQRGLSSFAIRNRLQTLLFLRQQATVRERLKIDDETLKLRLQLQRI